MATPGKILAVLAGLSLVVMAGSFVSALILGLLSMRFFPSYHPAAVGTLRERPWSTLGIGFVAAVITSVVCLVLFATVLGIPLALILAAAYLIVLYWGRIFAIHGLGDAICRRFRVTPRPPWAFVLGLVAYHLLALIPVIGWILMLLAALSGLGAELVARKGIYVAARSQEII